jgi:phage-related protein
MTYPVAFYENSRGEKVVESFFEKQSDQILAEFFRLIDTLSLLGPNLSLPDSKHLQKGLDELRIVGKNQIRILYTFRKGQYYLLHAFKKKSNQTPKKEIETALNRLDKI